MNLANWQLKKKKKLKLMFTLAEIEKAVPASSVSCFLDSKWQILPLDLVTPLVGV